MPSETFEADLDGRPGLVGITFDADGVTVGFLRSDTSKVQYRPIRATLPPDETVRFQEFIGRVASGSNARLNQAKDRAIRAAEAMASAQSELNASVKNLRVASGAAFGKTVADINDDSNTVHITGPHTLDDDLINELTNLFDPGDASR